MDTTRNIDAQEQDMPAAHAIPPDMVDKIQFADGTVDMEGSGDNGAANTPEAIETRRRLTRKLVRSNVPLDELMNIAGGTKGYQVLQRMNAEELKTFEEVLEEKLMVEPVENTYTVAEKWFLAWVSEYISEQAATRIHESGLVVSLLRYLWNRSIGKAPGAIQDMVLLSGLMLAGAVGNNRKRPAEQGGPLSDQIGDNKVERYRHERQLREERESMDVEIDNTSEAEEVSKDDDDEELTQEQAEMYARELERLRQSRLGGLHQSQLLALNQ